MFCNRLRIRTLTPVIISGVLSLSFLPSYADGYVGVGTGPGVEFQAGVNGPGTSFGVSVGGAGVSINFGGPAGGLPTRNGLPPTCLDSFVYEAGGQAELIYGDEGSNGPPPYGLSSSSLGGGAGISIPGAGVGIDIGIGGGGDGFDASHRINAGITGINAQGLTTGHGSYLPDAWGRDEFQGGDSSGASPNLSVGVPGGPSLSIGVGGSSPGGGEWSMSGAGQSSGIILSGF